MFWGFVFCGWGVGGVVLEIFLATEDFVYCESLWYIA